VPPFRDPKTDEPFYVVNVDLIIKAPDPETAEQIAFEQVDESGPVVEVLLYGRSYEASEDTVKSTSWWTWEYGTDEEQDALMRRIDPTWKGWKELAADQEKTGV
jgi:hypothetical protein